MELPEICSFCRKPKSEVEKLIAGEDGVAICNRCVAFCYDVLQQERVDMTSWRGTEPPSGLKGDK
jgi:ATP-dependent protease Clp ATPase subunit